MKNFNEFLLTLTEDEIVTIMDKTNDSIQSLQNDTPSKYHLGNQISALSLTVNIELLKRYHEWLHQV